MTKLAATEVAALDPYKFMATIGKRVIHPGGRVSTQAVLARARITASSKVLDVGCGVATTAIEIGRRFGAQVVAVDIAPLMLERAEANVHAAKMTGRVTVRQGDICALPFDDGIDTHRARSWQRPRLHVWLTHQPRGWPTAGIESGISITRADSPTRQNVLLCAGTTK